jgi:hypothetical protein
LGRKSKLGLFDYLKSSYDIGPQFTNVELHTKDIDEYGSGGTMTHYYLDKSGILWYGDYKGTSTFEEIPEDDERYSNKLLFLNFEWIPTGQRGKYRVHSITKYVEVYIPEWKGDYDAWPRCRLHLIQGKLQDFMHITR